MYIATVFFPLVGSFFSFFFGKFLGRVGVCYCSCFFIFLSLLISFIAFIQVGFLGQVSAVSFFSWINSGLFYVDWCFLFDSLTVVMLVVVCFVSLVVHMYSTFYIEADPHVTRFISYLSLFTFFILILVTADNFIQIFVGWEGVGLCSFLLINFWFTRIQANKAAIKAMLINRVGDFGLCLGILFIFFEFGAVDYATVFSIAPFVSSGGTNSLFFFYSFDSLTIISLLLFVGAVGKSAQLGLHTWLPDAIEGPTPVSALIHAATMVTAGVFLLSRCSPLLEYSNQALFIITLVGGSTAFFAASVGLIQNDLKKVVAYSTCSQLGYIIFACGLSSYSVGIFHLGNHAFFKALLFLSSGAVIHAINDEQDIRKIGGLAKLLPITYCFILFGSIALIGFPFLAGFYSKDALLEISYGGYSFDSHFTNFLGVSAAFFTAFYSIRLLFLTFLAKARSFKKVIENAHEADSTVMLLCLVPLFLFSIFVGFFMKDSFIGPGTSFWNNSLFINPINNKVFEGEFLATSVKLTPVIVSLSGFFTAYLTYMYFLKNLNSFKLSYYGRVFYTFFNKKWFFDKLYNEVFTQKGLNFGYTKSYKLMDRGIVEIVGPLGFSFFFFNMTRSFSKYHSGLVYHYMFSIFVVIIFFTGCFAFF